MANFSPNVKASDAKQQHAPRWNSCTTAEIENPTTKVVSSSTFQGYVSPFTISRGPGNSLTSYYLHVKGGNAVAVQNLIFPPREQVQLSSATSGGCGSGTAEQSTGHVIEDNETKKLNAYDFRQEPDIDFFTFAR